MREARLIEIADVPLAKIDAGGRLRKVSPKALDSLEASVDELGFVLDEIHLRRVRHQGGKLKLMAGGHRLALAHRKDWTTIKAKIWDCSDDWAALVEIDDNLAHSELAPMELAVFLARRKAIYERLYPETRQGGDRGNQHTGGRQTDMMSFCQSIAEKRDLSERHVRRLIAVGGALSEDDIADLEATAAVTGRQVALADLQALAKLGEPEERRRAIWTFCNGTSLKTLRKAIDFNRREAEATPPKDPVEEAFKALMTAWKRAPRAARRRFLSEVHGDLYPLMVATMSGDEGGAA